MIRTEELLSEISAKLDRLPEISEKLDRVLALIAIQGVGEAEQVSRLDSMGLDQRTIASVTGLRPNTVAVRLFRMRKAGGRR